MSVRTFYPSSPRRPSSYVEPKITCYRFLRKVVRLTVTSRHYVEHILFERYPGNVLRLIVLLGFQFTNSVCGLWCNSPVKLHTMPFPCRAHAAPLPYRAAKGLDCLSHLIYTVRPRLIHTYHATPVSCHDHAVLKATSQGHGTARHGRVMASVN
jgi:hypothetical protein